MLRDELRRRLLEERSVYVKECCDRCGQLLGPVRSARRGEPGEWCSRECRDGVDRSLEHAALVQRKHANLAELVAARRASGCARMERLRQRKAGLQPTVNQQDRSVTFSA